MRTAFVLSLFCSAALAQSQPEVKDGKVVIPMTLSPADVKRPLSRFYLTPQYTDMQPGNKIPGFLKAFAEQDLFFSKENMERRYKWDELKLADLPIEEMKKSDGIVAGMAYRDPKKAAWESYGGRPLSDVDEAARLLSTDWQVWFGIRRDSIGLLLPEVQKMRTLAFVLKQRMRYEIRVGDFERAAYTARTFYGLAKAFEEHPTLIGLLVGIAIESVCLNALEEMIAQPGCPNLYWSFAEMPEVVLSARLPFQGERTLVKSLFAGFSEIEHKMTPEELAREIAKMRGVFGMMGGAKVPIPVELQFAMLAADEKSLAAARAYLVETGSKADAAKTFGPVQAVIAADVRRYEVLLDDTYSMMNLPFWEAKPHLDTFNKKLAEAKDILIARQLLPAVAKVREAQARIQQKVAILRTIEAIRLHAHENKGALPDKLVDIKVPVPDDPVTGKPFEYSVKDGVATLHGANPQPQSLAMNRYYELRIKK